MLSLRPKLDVVFLSVSTPAYKVWNGLPDGGLFSHIPNSTEVQIILSEYTGLFPDDVKATLPKLYSQEGVKDPTVYVKFFTPDSGWTWYATEGEQQGEDFIFFGYVIGHEREWGYFSLNELSSAKGPLGLPIERDIHFSPKKKSEIPDIT